LKQHYRILLVDDESDILGVLKRGLEAKGFRVDAYDSPQEAIDYFKPNVYDLAILDIRMPGLNGFALYRQMRKIDPSLTACFLSAFEIHPEEFKKVFPSMADSVKTIIKKPVTISNLIKETTPFLRISAVARARRGEHFLIAFDTPQELIEQSLQFLKIGLLEKDEDILLVTDELPKDKIREKII
jgi:DNA-binding response OmpR family regulator